MSPARLTISENKKYKILKRRNIPISPSLKILQGIIKSPCMTEEVELLELKNQ